MEWNVDLQPYQEEFFYSEARFPAMVTAWATGKTFNLILKAVALSEKYPKNQGLILRKNYTDLKDSTMSDFELYTGLKINQQNKRVVLPNGSIILFHHADELAGVVQNINLGWFGIEQAEEFDSDEVFMKLRGRLRRKNSTRQGMIIANTKGHNWVYRLWKLKEKTLSEKEIDGIANDSGFDKDKLRKDEYHLIEAKTFDNKKNLTEDFLIDLAKMKAEHPANYNRFVMNSWEDVDVEDRVIPYNSLRNAVKLDIRDYDSNKVVISCDPAEYGNDKTVIYVLKGLKVIDSRQTSKKSLMETAGEIMRLIQKHNAEVVAIDDIGVGAGVRARLVELKGESHSADIMSINSARKGNGNYYRLREEMWFSASALFKDDRVSIPDDERLIEDLSAYTYSLNSKGQMIMCKKSDVKKNLGRSTDCGDALIMGLWAAEKNKGHKVQPIVYSNEEEYEPLTYGL